MSHVGRGEPRLLALPAGLLVAFLGLPVAVLLWRAASGGALVAALTSGAVGAALGLSLATTSVSLVIGAALGLPLARLLARSRSRRAALVEAVVDLPVVLPPSVAGLALLLLFGRQGPFGGPLAALGLGLPFSTAAVVLAQVLVAAPLLVRTARTGFAAVDPELEDAARVDGASERAVLRHVTLPTAAPAIAAGLVLAWARALGEFGATILFAGNVAGRTQTLPLLVYEAFQSDLEVAVAASAVLVLAALGVLLAVRLRHWRPVSELRSVG
ncbi:MAG TPA: ABC transporter permease [Candidatus Limnocylindrales bacterium]|nr:ABC transporter permease [Candidatus Limnocylindrales bacterium]